MQIKGIANRIRSTATILSDIREFFKDFAAQGRELPDEPLPNVKSLYDEMQSCTDMFDWVKHQIYDAVKDLPSPSVGYVVREKRELEQGTLAELKGSIRVAEDAIHDHKLNLHIQLSLFSSRMQNQLVQVHALLLRQRKADGKVATSSK